MRKKIVSPEETPVVELIEGKGGKEHAFYWHIYAGATRAGQVYIDWANDTILGKHASIHIFLNKRSQGKGIGRKGYALACEKSGLAQIYAHMRKSNLPSKYAAAAAGFKQVSNDKFAQLVMVWKRESN